MKALREANRIREKEWDANSRIDLSYRGNELGGECGEAQNIIKKLERERLGLRGTRTTIERLAEELADVLICADLIAMHFEIDIEEAVHKKFNMTSDKYNLKTHYLRSEDTVSLQMNALCRELSNESDLRGRCMRCGAELGEACKEKKP